jgi:ATP/maltotriose-dependent transcriptional regulator MalT
MGGPPTRAANRPGPTPNGCAAPAAKAFFTVISRPVLCRPFIGRHEELAYLRERRLAAGSSRGGFVLIAGDAGVGKSRLVSEFCRSLAYSRWKIATGGCVEFASRPYGPIREVLGRLGGKPFELGEASSKQEQFDAIVERIASVAAKSALVVVIEDIHWADAATLDFLGYLSTKIERSRVLVLASFRADELHAEHPAARATARIARSAQSGRIDLTPLRGAELQTFIDEALGDIPLSEQKKRAVAAAGEGNPFFTEELLKSAVEDVVPAAPAKERRLPPTLRATLIERLRPFDESEREVIAQAAMIGRSFDLDLLAATLDAEPVELLPILRRARDFQLVEETGPAAFRFRHGLTRDAIYAEFLTAELQPRHRAIASTLEEVPAERRSPEALAYHWLAAGDGERAARYNKLAGEKAAAVHAYVDAIAFYERAIECCSDAAERGEIAKKMGDCRLTSGSTKEAQASYEAAAEEFRSIGAFEREATSRAAAAITAYGIGLPTPTQPLESMLARLEPGEYVARSRVLLGLAWLDATFGFPTRAAGYLAQIDRRALSATDIALRFYNVTAFNAMTVGDLDAFRVGHVAWVEAARAQGSTQLEASAFVNGAMCRAFFGLHDEAERDLEQTFRLARETKSRHLEESAYTFSALCRLLRGDLNGVREALEHVSPESENRVNISFATAWGSIAGAALDDRAMIERWFDRFESKIDFAADPECAGGFAEIMVRRGRLLDAQHLLARALPECELMRGNIPTLLAAGRYGTDETRQRARTFLARAAAAPVETPERAALALFDAIERKRDGDRTESAAMAAEAAAGFNRLGMPLFEAHAREAAGEIEAALALYRLCGATYDVRRLDKDVPQAAPPVAASARTERGLSAREREIATLAAAGRSNLEIARALSISHKTVEKHLAATYEKLAISSRVQLATHLDMKEPRASSV